VVPDINRRASHDRKAAGSALDSEAQGTGIGLSRQSLFYLQLLRDIATPSWKRHLHFGTCMAVEIDPFGGTIFHRRYPKHLAGVFEVVQTEVQAEQPNPRFAANQLLRDTNQDLAQCQQELEQAYYSGVCSWPFPYGGLSYGERPIQVRSQPSGLLRHLPAPKPARKVIRLYRQNRILFRSLSYYSEGRALLNSLPAKAQAKVTIDPQLPRTTLEAFLDRLEAYELNLDFPPLLKLIGSDYAQSASAQFPGITIRMTGGGRKGYSELRVSTRNEKFAKSELPLKSRIDFWHTLTQL